MNASDRLVSISHEIKTLNGNNENLEKDLESIVELNNSCISFIKTMKSA